jgi:hypothetical protein
MYASITTVQFSPEKLDEMFSAVRDMFPTFAPRATGLQEAFVIADRATGKSMTISLWDTEANRNANEGLWKDAMSKVAGFAIGQPVRQGYDTVERFEV